MLSGQGETLLHGTVNAGIAQGLLALKQRIDAAKIPPSKLTETMNIAQAFACHESKLNHAKVSGGGISYLSDAGARR